MIVKGFVKQYKSGFKTLVRLPKSTVEIKWFKTLDEARKKTEQHVWRYCGGLVVKWDERVVKCGGLRK